MLPVVQLLVEGLHVRLAKVVKGFDNYGKSVAKSLDAGVDEPSSKFDGVVLCFNLAEFLGVKGDLCVLVILPECAVEAGLADVHNDKGL